MSCEEYLDALTEVALGGEPDARLRAHLAECAACRAEQQRLASLASAMDRGVAAVMDAEPSPGFVVRVRQRVAEDSEQRVAWWRGWVPALAGGLAVVTLAVWLVWPGLTSREPRKSTESPTIAALPTPTKPPVSPSAGSETPADRGVHSPVRRASNTSKSERPPRGSEPAKPPALPEVLVAGDEWKQVANLYALAQRGSVSAEQLAPPELTPMEGTVPALAIARLESQPIAIRPPAENLPGAARQ